MTPQEAAQLLNIEERISLVATSGWEMCREEFIRVRLELADLVRKAKKFHHPDHGGKAENFHKIDEAARYFVAVELRDLVTAFLPTSTPKKLTFCPKCGGNAQFRGIDCPDCGGRGTIII